MLYSAVLFVVQCVLGQGVCLEIGCVGLAVEGSACGGCRARHARHIGRVARDHEVTQVRRQRFQKHRCIHL